MPENKYEVARAAQTGQKINIADFREKMEVLEMSTLKAESRAMEKNIVEKKKEIDSAIKSAKENPLPRKTLARFDREFGKQREKNAFKTAIVLFLCAIVISMFLQPSLFFIRDNNGLKLVNYSQRELENVSIYSFNDIVGGNTTPLFFLAKVGPKTELPMVNKETSVLIALADRQLPAIGVYTDQNINNGKSVYKTGQTAREMYDNMLNNPSDTNG